MSFKIHLIIIVFIIFAVLISWHWMSDTPVKIAVPQPETSRFSIIVVHASWGLNCMYVNDGTNTPPDAFAPSAQNPNSGKPHEDNVLEKVSELCNGKSQCSLPVNSSALGLDPSSGCMDKALEIEYRCFSYDRPWTARSSSGTLHIDCEKTAK